MLQVFTFAALVGDSLQFGTHFLIHSLLHLVFFLNGFNLLA